MLFLDLVAYAIQFGEARDWGKGQRFGERFRVYTGHGNPKNHVAGGTNRTEIVGFKLKIGTTNQRCVLECGVFHMVHRLKLQFLFLSESYPPPLHPAYLLDTLQYLFRQPAHTCRYCGSQILKLCRKLRTSFPALRIYSRIQCPRFENILKLVYRGRESGSGLERVGIGLQGRGSRVEG
eukprot:2381349-Rhodomonas_salina.1